MPEETIYESEEKRSRRGLASFFRRIANALSRGDPVPIDKEQTVTVDPPAETNLEVEVGREGNDHSVEFELEWVGSADDIETGVDASKATFELYEDCEQMYRWRLVHDNGNIIADGGEGYSAKRKARQGLESVKANVPGAVVVDQSVEDPDAAGEGATSDATVELYEDTAGQWRWRLVHDNGEIIADGSQGYSSKQKAQQGIRSVKQNARGAPVEEMD